MANTRISIEYCTGWGYLSKAMDMTEKILDQYKNTIDNLVLIPSTNGVFEITVNDNLVFSKIKEERFPKFEEIKGKI